MRFMKEVIPARVVTVDLPPASSARHVGRRFRLQELIAIDPPSPAVASEQLIRLFGPPGACRIIWKITGSECLPYIQDRGHDAPAGLDHVCPLKQRGVSDHANQTATPDGSSTKDSRASPGGTASWAPAIALPRANKRALYCDHNARVCRRSAPVLISHSTKPR